MAEPTQSRLAAIRARLAAAVVTELERRANTLANMAPQPPAFDVKDIETLLTIAEAADQLLAALRAAPQEERAFAVYVWATEPSIPPAPTVHAALAALEAALGDGEPGA